MLGYHGDPAATASSIDSVGPCCCLLSTAMQEAQLPACMLPLGCFMVVPQCITLLAHAPFLADLPPQPTTRPLCRRAGCTAATWRCLTTEATARLWAE
jgi:hypothetical protein